MVIVVILIFQVSVNTRMFSTTRVTLGQTDATMNASVKMRLPVTTGVMKGEKLNSSVLSCSFEANGLAHIYLNLSHVF